MLLSLEQSSPIAPHWQLILSCVNLKGKLSPLAWGAPQAPLDSALIVRLSPSPTRYGTSSLAAAAALGLSAQQSSMGMSASQLRVVGVNFLTEECLLVSIWTLRVAAHRLTQHLSTKFDLMPMAQANSQMKCPNLSCCILQALDIISRLHHNAHTPMLISEPLLTTRTLMPSMYSSVSTPLVA